MYFHTDVPEMIIVKGDMAPVHGEWWNMIRILM